MLMGATISDSGKTLDKESKDLGWRPDCVPIYGVKLGFLFVYSTAKREVQLRQSMPKDLDNGNHPRRFHDCYFPLLFPRFQHGSELGLRSLNMRYGGAGCHITRDHNTQGFCHKVVGIV